MTSTYFDCDAVLFDMDGTIVDSRHIVERTWIRWASEHGIPIETALAQAHGRRTLETMQLLAPHLATEEEAAKLDAQEEEEDGSETAIAGAADLLSALPAARWAVVTSAGHALALRRIAVVGKPSPEGYLRAAERLGVAANRCIVIEDTPAGAEAGRAAGAKVIGVATTFSTVSPCDVLVRDLRDVKPAAPRDGWTIRLIIDRPPPV